MKNIITNLLSPYFLALHFCLLRACALRDNLGIILKFINLFCAATPC